MPGEAVFVGVIVERATAEDRLHLVVEVARAFVSIKIGIVSRHVLEE